MSSSTSTYPPWYLHPFILFNIENQLTAWAAAYTKPQSTIRPVVLVVLIFLSGYSFYWFPTYVNTIAWPARCFGGAVLLAPLGFFDRLVLRGWAYGDEYPGPTDKPKKLKGVDGNEVDGTEGKAQKMSPPLTRRGYGQEVNSFMRGVGTAWEAKGIAHFSTTDPTYVPSQVEFVCRKTLSVVACYTIHSLIINALDYWKASPLLSSSHVPFLSRIGSVSMHEIYFRTVNTFLFWLWNYTMMEGFHAFFSILSACLDANNIKQWRPLFGSPTDSYTVRAFWGKSWHQAARNNLEGPARFITFSILHLPKESLAARYSNIFFAFLISGISHVGADRPGALGAERSGSLPFFCAQTVGIMIEDAVQEVYRRVCTKNTSQSRTPTWAKMVGYVWVVAFLAWSTPAWAYPIIRTINKEEATINLGAFRSILPTMPFWR